MLSVTRPLPPRARACLFYGMYDYPVTDYYFETIRGGRGLVASSRITRSRRRNIFPSQKANTANLGAGRTMPPVSRNIARSFRFDR